MKHNMGVIDRLIRVIVAVVFAVLFLAGVATGVAGGILLALAVIFLLTSFISFCPIYGLFGMDTKRTKPESN